MAAAPIDIQSDSQSEETQNGSKSKRRQKKYRYRKQGYHKSERENARRVEARAFLSGITLDERLRPLDPTDINLTALVHVTPNQNLSSPMLTMEETHTSTDLQRIEKLHEMVNFFDLQHQSPLKLTPSRSHDHGFDALAMVRSTSLFETAATPLTHETRRLGPVLSRSINNPEEHVGEVSYYDYDEISKLLPLHNKRVVLITSGDPFLVYSTLAYKKYEEKQNFEHPQRQRARLNSMSTQLDLDVELGGVINEVSLARLFRPVYQQSELDPGDIRIYGGKKGYQLGAKYDDVLDHPLPSSSGTNFPWAGFREHHSAQYIMVHYHPLCMDNYEYFVGPHISTLSQQSYRVSIIQYAKPSEHKKGINDQFSDCFPHVKITLSKLRSLKAELFDIAKEGNVDLATLAYSYVYFEKLVLMGKVTKSNRKLVAGVCLLLAAKFFTDMKKQDLKDLLDEISKTFRLSNEEVVSHELPVLAALHFSLLTPIYQVRNHYEVLRDKSSDD